MKRRSLSHFFIFTMLLVSACGQRDQLTTSSATATNAHPIVGSWGLASGQDLTVNSNGTAISSFCDLQAGIGDIDPMGRDQCGSASSSCGTFPYVVSHSLNHPNCVEPGTYICFYNVYRMAGKDHLILNCTDGKGAVTYDRL